MPLSKDEYKKIMKRIMKKYKLELESNLAQVLNFSEIISETKKFV